MNPRRCMQTQNKCLRWLWMWWTLGREHRRHFFPGSTLRQLCWYSWWMKLHRAICMTDLQVADGSTYNS
jgi:hypothetical protein